MVTLFIHGSDADDVLLPLGEEGLDYTVSMTEGYAPIEAR